MIRTVGYCLFGALTLLQSGCAQEKERTDRPPVIEVFACSDYCPGPEEKYLRNVYEGVNDAETCEAIGGKPHVYIGWGSFFVCLAD